MKWCTVNFGKAWGTYTAALCWTTSLLFCVTIPLHPTTVPLFCAIVLLTVLPCA